jgi:hypothetical protein
VNCFYRAIVKRRKITKRLGSAAVCIHIPFNQRNLLVGQSQTMALYIVKKKKRKKLTDGHKCPDLSLSPFPSVNYYVYLSLHFLIY